MSDLKLRVDTRSIHQPDSSESSPTTANSYITNLSTPNSSTTSLGIGYRFTRTFSDSICKILDLRIKKVEKEVNLDEFGEFWHSIENPDNSNNPNIQTQLNLSELSTLDARHDFILLKQDYTKILGELYLTKDTLFDRNEKIKNISKENKVLKQKVSILEQEKETFRQAFAKSQNQLMELQNNANYTVLSPIEQDNSNNRAILPEKSTSNISNRANREKLIENFINTPSNNIDLRKMGINDKNINFVMEKLKQYKDRKYITLDLRNISSHIDYTKVSGSGIFGGLSNIGLNTKIWGTNVGNVFTKGLATNTISDEGLETLLHGLIDSDIGISNIHYDESKISPLAMAKFLDTLNQCGKLDIKARTFLEIDSNNKKLQISKQYAKYALGKVLFALKDIQAEKIQILDISADIGIEEIKYTLDIAKQGYLPNLKQLKFVDIPQENKVLNVLSTQDDKDIFIKNIKSGIVDMLVSMPSSQLKSLSMTFGSDDDCHITNAINRIQNSKAIQLNASNITKPSRIVRQSVYIYSSKPLPAIPEDLQSNSGILRNPTQTSIHTQNTELSQATLQSEGTIDSTLYQQNNASNLRIVNPN